MILGGPHPAALVLTGTAALLYLAAARGFRKARADPSAAAPSAQPPASARQAWPTWPIWALVVAWAIHGALLAFGAGLLTNRPVLGFGPALSFTCWLALAVCAPEVRRYPQLPLAPWLAVAAGVGLVVAWAFAGSPLHAPGSMWLAVHGLLGLASYGLFAAAVVHAVLLRRAEKQLRQHTAAPALGVPLLTLERLTFRFVAAGFCVLTASLAVGAVYGQWFDNNLARLRVDHKTVFSVLAWLTFAALLWGRWRLGWRGARATRMLFGGAVLLLLAYVGSRFVLEVLLHRV